MQAVFTKFLPATNHHGDRIKVTCGNGRKSFTFPCDGRKGHLENHRLSAKRALQALDWNGKWVCGEWTYGFVYVRVPERRWRKRLFVQGM